MTDEALETTDTEEEKLLPETMDKANLELLQRALGRFMGTGPTIQIEEDDAFDATMCEYDLNRFREILSRIPGREQRRKSWMIMSDKREEAFERLSGLGTAHYMKYPHSVIVYGDTHMIQATITASAYLFEVAAVVVAECGQTQSILDEISEEMKDILAPIGDMAKVNVAWYYSVGGNLRSDYISEMISEDMHDEAYPGLSEGITQFIEDYLSSPSSVLLLSGTHGCGKSRLIRNIVQAHALKKEEHETDVLYTTDLDAMKDTDQFFIGFRTGDYDFLVLEDVDVLLKPRKSDDNKTMHKLLGASDGFLSNPTRKIILSTNLDNIEVDPALLRPGRCFGRVQLGALDLSEAVALAEKIVPGGGWKDKIETDMTVAEVYALAKDHKFYDVGGSANIGFTPSSKPGGIKS